MPRAPNDQGAEYQERSHVKDAKSQPKGRNSRTEPQGLKLVGIDFNIGLAAEDRLCTACPFQSRPPSGSRRNINGRTCTRFGCLSMRKSRSMRRSSEAMGRRRVSGASARDTVECERTDGAMTYVSPPGGFGGDAYLVPQRVEKQAPPVRV